MLWDFLWQWAAFLSRIATNIRVAHKRQTSIWLPSALNHYHLAQPRCQCCEWDHCQSQIRCILLQLCGAYLSGIQFPVAVLRRLCRWRHRVFDSASSCYPSTDSIRAASSTCKSFSWCYCSSLYRIVHGNAHFVWLKMMPARYLLHIGFSSRCLVFFDHTCLYFNSLSLFCVYSLLSNIVCRKRNEMVNETLSFL